MGMSLTAKLYYGFPLVEGDGENDTHDQEREDFLNDDESWETKEVEGHSVFKPQHQDYKSEDWKLYWKQSNKIVSALPCVIEWVGHTNYGYPVLAIRAVVLRKHSRDDTAITIPAIDPAWDGQLREWCEKYGFTYGTPSWQLAPRYA